MNHVSVVLMNLLSHLKIDGDDDGVMVTMVVMDGSDDDAHDC